MLFKVIDKLIYQYHYQHHGFCSQLFNFSRFRAMEGLLYNKREDRSIDSSCLQNTVKKLVSNLCETLIIYRTQLRIEGTVGITIDNERVIILHFGENIGKSCLSNERSSDKSSCASDKNVLHDLDPVAEEARKDAGEEFLQNSAATVNVTPSCATPKASRVSHSSSLPEEPKGRLQSSSAVTEVDSENETTYETSPDSVKVKIAEENNGSQSEILDSLLCASQSNDEVVANCYSGHSEHEGATLLDMTTDILSNLFSSGSSTDVTPLSCYDRGPMSEQSQGQLRQGSAIEALRQIYCKRFTNQGKDSVLYHSEGEFSPSISDHSVGISTEPKGKSPGKRDSTQSQALLRELLFQKVSPIAVAPAGGSGLHQPASKRRRVGNSSTDQAEKIASSTLFSEILSGRNNDIGSIGQNLKSKLLAVDDTRGTSHREDYSPELGRSGFPAGISFDQETDHSKYKFSQLLYHLVDSKRNSTNNLNSLYAEQGTSSSALKTYDGGFYHDGFVTEGGSTSVKEEVDDLEFGEVERSPYTS